MKICPMGAELFLADRQADVIALEKLMIFSPIFEGRKGVTTGSKYNGRCLYYV
jgi:hypothetical protein